MNVLWVLALGFYMLSAAFIVKDRLLSSIGMQIVAGICAIAGNYQP